MKILRSIILFIQHLTESNFVFSLKFSADTTLIGQNIIAELLQLSCLYNKRFLRFLSGWLKEPKLKDLFETVYKLEIFPGKISAVNPAFKPPRPLPKVKSSEEIVPAKKTISVGGRRKRYAYQYAPAIWNTANKQLDNNCYNYANNKATDTFAQPGRGSGAMCQYKRPDCMRNAAINDHLETLDLPPDAPLPLAPSGKKHLVALFINPGKKHRITFSYIGYKMWQTLI